MKNQLVYSNEPWFNLPIDTEQEEGLLGIDVDTTIIPSRERGFPLLVKCRKISPWKSQFGVCEAIGVYDIQIVLE